MTTSAVQFLAETRSFADRVRERALPAVSSYYWYHTVDLGNGLVTPGLHDYRGSLPDFQFPEDMRGMTVLDVGSATGFFAFEFERRGARVVSTELPSLDDLDRFPGQSVENSLRKIERMLGFTLHLGERISRNQKVRDQVVEAVRRDTDVSNLVRGFERAMYQVTASPEMFRPWHDMTSETHIGIGLEALQSAFFD